MKHLAISALVIALAVVGIAFPAKKTKPKAKAKPAVVKFAEAEKVFAASCIRCHGAGLPRGGIDLTTAASINKGGEDGPILVAGDPANSLLIKAMKGAAGVRKMPPRGDVSAADIKVVEGWIKAGAKG